MERLGLLLAHCGDRFEGRWALECSLAREHLVENRAESKDVAAGVRLFTLQLLGGNIGKRTNQLPLISQCRGHRVFIRRDRPPVFSKTEIEQFRSGAREHDVAGL